MYTYYNTDRTVIIFEGTFSWSDFIENNQLIE